MWKSRYFDLVIDFAVADWRKKRIAASGTWKSRCFDLVIDIAVVDRVDVNKFVKRNTKTGCRKTLYFEPLVDVVGGIDNPPSSKKLLHMFHKLPTNGSKSSMLIGVKKKLKFSPGSNNGAKNKCSLLTSATAMRSRSNASRT